MKHGKHRKRKQIKMPRFVLEGPRPCSIICFALVHMHELPNQNVSIG